MTITPIGFEGSVSDIQFSQRSRFEGQVFPVVGSRTDFALSTGSTDRAVNIAVGTACAHSIMVTSDTVQTLTLDAVTTTNAQRWDAVVLRYDWNANTVTPMLIKGTASVNAPAAIPAGIKVASTDIGQQYDQLIGLVRVNQGLSSIQQIVDRRLWNAKRVMAASSGALPPANVMAFGSEVALPDGTVYRCKLDSSNALTWVSDGAVGVTELTGTSVFAATTGWSVDPTHTVRCLISSPYERQLDIQVRRTGADINAADDDGNFGDTPIGTFAANHRPDVQMFPTISYLDGNTDCLGLTRLGTDGQLTLLAGQPGNDLTKKTTAGDVSLRLSLRFSTRKAAA